MADPNNQRRHRQQHANAVLIHQAISQPTHLRRQAPVFGKHRCKERKSCKGSIGGQHQNQQGGELEQPKQDAAAAKHANADLGQNGDLRIRRNAVHEAQASHGQEHRCEQTTHHKQRHASIARRGFTKHLHASGNGLNPCHRRTARAERPQDQKQP